LALRTCKRDLIDDPAVEDEHDNESCNKLKVESNLAVQLMTSVARHELREGQERDPLCGASAKQKGKRKERVLQLQPNQFQELILHWSTRHCLMIQSYIEKSDILDNQLKVHDTVP
jgi:hypothetical protein